MPFPWLTVFLPGTHATSAAKKTWTTEDQRTIVEATKKSGNNKIPFVGGHPKNNLPIFGYFSKDDIRIGEHDGKPAIQVRPCEFADGGFDALSNSEYDKVSIKVTKGVIDHIGFVKNPAVKGLPALGSYQFSEEEDSELIEGQFSWPTGFEYGVTNRFSAIIDAFQRMREDIIATDGNSDRADKIIPKDMLDQFTSQLPNLADDLTWMIADEVRKQLESKQSNQSSLFEDNMDPNKKGEEKPTESKTPVATAQFEAEQEALRKENEALTKRVAVLEAENQTAKFSSIVDAGIAAGKIMPAERDLHIQTMNALSSVSGAQFSADQKSPLDNYIAALEARAPLAGMFSSIANQSSAVSAQQGDDDKAIEEFNKSRGN